MRTIDIINETINISIDLVKKFNNESFYATFYSLNKLLYFLQKQMYREYDKPIIDTNIFAITSGPFVEETQEIFYKYSYEKIKEKQGEGIILPPSVKKVIENVIINFGCLSDREIGILSKKEIAWQKAYLNKEKEITENLIKETIFQEEVVVKVYKKFNEGSDIQ